jgi:hypothetical protein
MQAMAATSSSSGSGSGTGRGGLLGEIREGAKLKKTSQPESAVAGPPLTLGLQLGATASAAEDTCDATWATWDAEICVWYARSLTSRLLRGVSRSLVLEQKVLDWLALSNTQLVYLLSQFGRSQDIMAQFLRFRDNDLHAQASRGAVDMVGSVWADMVQVTLLHHSLLPTRVITPVYTSTASASASATATTTTAAHETIASTLTPPLSGPPLPSAPQAWPCPSCTFLNDSDSTVCQVCESPKPTVVAATAMMGPPLTSSGPPPPPGPPLPPGPPVVSRGPPLAGPPLVNSSGSPSAAPLTLRLQTVPLPVPARTSDTGYGCAAYVLPSALTAQCAAFEAWLASKGQLVHPLPDPAKSTTRPLTWALDHSTAVLTLTFAAVSFDVLVSTCQMLILLALEHGKAMTEDALLAKVGGTQVAVQHALQALTSKAHPLVTPTETGYVLSDWSPPSSHPVRSDDDHTPLVVVRSPSSVAIINPYTPQLVMPEDTSDGDAIVSQCTLRVLASGRRTEMRSASSPAAESNVIEEWRARFRNPPAARTALSAASSTFSSTALPFSAAHHVRVAKLATMARHEDRLQQLGEWLYPLVADMDSENAGKITGMLLEMAEDGLLQMIDHASVLRKWVADAQDVLRDAGELRSPPSLERYDGGSPAVSLERYDGGSPAVLEPVD